MPGLLFSEQRMLGSRQTASCLTFLLLNASGVWGFVLALIRPPQFKHAVLPATKAATLTAKQIFFLHNCFLFGPFMLSYCPVIIPLSQHIPQSSQQPWTAEGGPCIDHHLNEQGASAAWWQG